MGGGFIPPVAIIGRRTTRRGKRLAVRRGGA